MKKNIWRQRQFRRKRNQRKLTARSKRPRLVVFRSNKYIYAQIIDCENGKILFSVTEKELEKGKENKTQRADKLGLLLAQKVKKSKITEVVFDRGEYRYHGRVKALAEAARKGGLKF